MARQAGGRAGEAWRVGEAEMAMRADNGRWAGEMGGGGRPRPRPRRGEAGRVWAEGVEEEKWEEEEGARRRRRRRNWQ